MDIKKLTKKLSKARDDIVNNHEISEENEKLLESLLFEPVEVEQNALKQRMAKNDNKILTDEQHYRLRLIEKTGTGSTAIH